MNPANISFDNPTDSQTAYPSSMPSLNHESVDNSSNNNKNNKDNVKPNVKPKTDEMFKFLNISAKTILTFAIANAIGFALKDFMNALVHNILQPCIMLMIMYFDSNNYLPITQGLRTKEVYIDVAKFLGNMLVLKLIIGSMYFLYKYSSVLL